LIASLTLFCLSILAGIELWHGLHKVMVHIFLLFGMLLIVRHIFLIFAAWQRHKQLPIAQTMKDLPSVTIIIPAYNEEAVIHDSLSSLLQLNYPDVEIIMIDDGSTDKTVSIAKALQCKNLKRTLHIITQTNAGKASALNTGLHHAMGELVLCVDSDSKLSPDSLRWGVEHFNDPKVVAVAGHVEVVNPSSLLTRFQQLEYQISQNFVRRGLSWFGVVTVIPGPVGLFKTQALLDISGYKEDKNLFAEDADLTVRLLAKGWRIVSEDRMVASTEAPEKIYPLLRQRYRWKRGIYQTLHLNFFELILAKKNRQLVLAGLLILDGFLMEIISFAITLFILASFFRFTELKLLYMWFGLLFSLDVIVLIFAIGKQWWKMLPLLFLQKLVYGYALQGWGALSLLDEWRSSSMSWDKIERVGGLS
jgi:cellulose synthase/poly-beta-1,6-N-acetylglucosamine synthase-like glycosyltransferase